MGGSVALHQTSLPLTGASSALAFFLAAPDHISRGFIFLRIRAGASHEATPLFRVWRSAGHWPVPSNWGIHFRVHHVPNPERMQSLHTEDGGSGRIYDCKT